MTTNFFAVVGHASLGSRLRTFTELLTKDAERVYTLFGVQDFKARWFPVFYALRDIESMSINEIARSIGQSHVAVSRTVRELKAAGLLEETPGKDARFTAVRHTAKGREVVQYVQVQCEAVAKAVKEIDDEAGVSLWHALERWEAALERESLFDRVRRAKEEKETNHV